MSELNSTKISPAIFKKQKIATVRNVLKIRWEKIEEIHRTYMFTFNQFICRIYIRKRIFFRIEANFFPWQRVRYVLELKKFLLSTSCFLGTRGNWFTRWWLLAESRTAGCWLGPHYWEMRCHCSEAASRNISARVRAWTFAFIDATDASYS